MMGHYLQLAIQSMFVENMALAFFLGMCSFIACSRRVETALGLGVAVLVVQVLTLPLNNLLLHQLLAEGALGWLHESLTWVDLTFLTFIVFISTIAATVQIVEMVLDRHFPALYTALGVFLPLIAVNCAILGGSLLMAERDYSFPESVVYGFGTGFGFLLAIVALAAVRERLAYANPPAALRGMGLTFIVVGLMSIGFMVFSGMQF
jgi:Na+-transporting NADH:ubiquinone oxidoreductase subunit E